MIKKTVVSMGLSRTSRNMIVLEISDEHSGNRIIEVEMSLKEMGLLVTGLHGVKGEAEVHPLANIAQKAVTEPVFCDKVFGDKDKQCTIVHTDFLQYKEFGWELWDDGLRSQQNGERHKYTIRRYEDIPEDEVLKAKRYY
ncbi:hypothetical protein NVP1101O_015 [Vibrio phage 1.101.O._10N.261.45.C6]|nr:hypothetical protein NVP1101O_015 [Vibrio phage 1.101.O._10N.261.45.C6]